MKGHYNEVISLHMPVKLIAEDINNKPVLIISNLSERNNDPQIFVNSSGVSIIGFNISKKNNDGAYIAIHVLTDISSSDHINISQNSIHGYSQGILVENYNGRLNLSDNYISVPSSGQCSQTRPWWGGIGVIRCNNASITSNIIECLDKRGSFTNGIYIKSSRNIYAKGNHFANLRCGIIVVDDPYRIINDPCSPNNSFDNVSMHYADNRKSIDLCTIGDIR